MSQTTHRYSADERIPIGEATRILGVAANTLRRWEAEGKIKSTRTPGNQRRYLLGDVEALAAGDSPVANGHDSPASKRVAS
ncbi:helix-turn-helix domain-containing protein [Brevibacterium sediminis]|uniref:MerR family DNA-binding transcriptional regulator n=1 Tax=Brevibacterium sediminis TaxID=1857024 RepID=UPI0035BE17EE|nr:helix-turn-helix domain-containing protein [Brevibacterium sediminis]